MTEFDPITIRFPGHGPELSWGRAVGLPERRVLLVDDPGNPGTSVRGAVGAAATVAVQALGFERVHAILLWTPDDPLAGNSMWLADLDGLEETWEPVQWRAD